MPTVPGQPQGAEPTASAPEEPSKEYLLMAAAAMHSMGRLYSIPDISVPPILKNTQDQYHAHLESLKKA